LRIGEPEAGLALSAAKKLRIQPEELLEFRPVAKSLDARGRGRGREPRFVCSVEFALGESGAKVHTPALRRALRSGKLKEAAPIVPLEVSGVHSSLKEGASKRAVVIGAGPAGLFAALTIARSGLPTTLIDRGSAIEKRSSELVRFHRSRVPNPESNLLYGEGGAGTYSDGKIYTRVEHPLETTLLKELVRCGAPPEILYDSLAHIGTDKLHRILPKFRRGLEAEGVTFAWNVRADGLVLRDGVGSTRRIAAVETSAGELPCDVCFIAPGHSARDTWRWLSEAGVQLEAKPFQIGVRVEHPQELIDRGRYGESEALHSLGAASYQLRAKATQNQPPAHTFCMCPGGKIVASVNDAGLLCTNGMSNSTHSSRWANAAVVTTVGPETFGHGPFDGVEFQRELEERFFLAGGENYDAPAQRVPDFLAGATSSDTLRSSYTFGLKPERIDRLLPSDLRSALAHGLAAFDVALPG
ncbi:MAG: FAD-dependent protein, partial [Planctomycetota bacterium]